MSEKEQPTSITSNKNHSGNHTNPNFSAFVESAANTFTNITTFRVTRIISPQEVVHEVFLGIDDLRPQDRGPQYLKEARTIAVHKGTPPDIIA